jgi:hypothetical protein
MAASPAKHLDRRAVVDFVRDEIGLPLSMSTLRKMCMRGEGPPPAMRWGSRYLYDSADIRHWAQQRARRALSREAS